MLSRQAVAALDELPRHRRARLRCRLQAAPRPLDAADRPSARRGQRAWHARPLDERRHALADEERQVPARRRAPRPHRGLDRTGPGAATRTSSPRRTSGSRTCSSGSASPSPKGPEVESDWYNFQALNMPPAPSGPQRVGHAVRRPRRARQRGAAHPHLAGADPGDGDQPPPLYVVMPGRVFRQRHPRRHPHAGLPPDRGPRRRPGHHLRRPRRHHRGVHQGLLRAGLLVAPAPVLLPVHRAVGRVRHPASRRLVARARGLRHGAPERAAQRAASTPRSGAASPSASAPTACR